MVEHDAEVIRAADHLVDLGPGAGRHGGRVVAEGTPAEVAFDVPERDYSWMAYLANAGFDVFAMDTTGYGRSIALDRGAAVETFLREGPRVAERELQGMQTSTFWPRLLASLGHTVPYDASVKPFEELARKILRAAGGFFGGGATQNRASTAEACS